MVCFWQRHSCSRLTALLQFLRSGRSPTLRCADFFGSAGALPFRKTIRYSPLAIRCHLGSALASPSQSHILPKSLPYCLQVLTTLIIQPANLHLSFDPSVNMVASQITQISPCVNTNYSPFKVIFLSHPRCLQCRWKVALLMG